MLGVAVEAACVRPCAGFVTRAGWLAAFRSSQPGALVCLVARVGPPVSASQGRWSVVDCVNRIFAVDQTKAQAKCEETDRKMHPNGGGHTFCQLPCIPMPELLHRC